MPKYKVIKTSNLVDSLVIIEADTVQEAQVKAHEFVEEYNNLGNGHENNWTLKSVTAIIDTAPPSDPEPEPIIEPPPRDLE